MPEGVQAIVVFLVALLTLGPLLTVAAPRLLPPAARDFWGGLGRAGRAFAVAVLVAVAGFSVSKEPLRSSPSPQPSLPGWFVALGYDATDTDGDGIPDSWERWTRTDPAAADAGLDPDGDGVDNFAEFWSQSDPLLADTDGDGIDDATEIAGLAAGVPDLNPIVRAAFPAEDGGGGIPAAWQYAAQSLLAGLDANGFPVGCNVPAAGASNYDVLVTVTSSRFALLSWGGGAGESVLLPPCTNLAVRIRLDGGDTRGVTLSAVPEGSGAGPLGTWQAEMSSAWDGRRGQSTEGNRVQTGAGTMVDCEAEGCAVSFAGALVSGGGMRGAGPGGSVSIPFVPKWMYLNALGQWSCWEHGAPPPVELVETNVPPPYLWSDGDGESESSERIFYPGSPEFYIDGITVCCREADASHTNLVLEASIGLTADHCGQPTTNIVGAASGSTHNPTNATDHLPEVAPEAIWQHGPSCPLTTNLLVKAGWTHNTAMLRIRNLVRIITHDPWDDETDHCIGLVWRNGGSISLYDYLDDDCKPYADKFAYAVNGSPCDGTLEFGAEPGEFHPTVFHVELRSKENGATLDRMWVVVNSPKAQKEFNNWYVENADTSWVNTLPKPYAKLQISSSWLWGDSATPVNPTNPDPWSSPSKLSGYLHHDSRWEMRSGPDADGHGNQACYDANGDIVLSGIGGGTADYFAGTIGTVSSHVDADVNPYLHALHLDGNPGDTGWLNGISRPCLYQGGNLDKYIERRPIIHPGGE